jgi:Rps23 Pro-64 3,4-dihydroxylase Tpa1-like proline 4-hydroxylase
MKTLWSSNIQIIDNFVEDNTLCDTLKRESLISKTVEGQNNSNLSDAQKEIYFMVNITFINYCIKCQIDYNTLKLSNLQKGCLYKYDESMVSNHLYEPHHDMVEQSYITAIYYVDSSYKEKEWCGGELTIYKHLTFVDYPENIINVLPKPNRLIIFPGFLTHRVKPYFGDKPRSSLVFGWRVENKTSNTVITI